MTERGAGSHPAALEQLVSAMIRETRALADLLAQEKAALAAADVDLLEVVNAEKFACVDRIEALETARRHRLAQAGFGSDSDAMQQLAAERGEHSTLLDGWSELMALTRRCQSQNLENAAVGRLRHAQMREALILLSGQPETAAVYDAQGLDTNAATHRQLGLA